LENIIIQGDDLNAKVLDFGLSIKQCKSSLLKTSCGTFSYMAPEIHESLLYDGKKADVFSMGILLFIFVQGHFPFASAQ